MERLLWIGMVCCAVAQPGLAQQDVFRPEGLRCEYLHNPLGVDVVTPRLSWQFHENESAPEKNLKQIAYQILVASTPEILAAGGGDLWDSGRVESPEQLNISYAGTALRPGQRVWWQVRSWSNHGHAGVSEPAWWEMGLLEESNWGASWIQRTEPPAPNEQDWFSERPAPLLRKEFTLQKPVRRARAYVCGLGYNELRLNGARVGSHELEPGWTSYGKRVFYSVYDVTAQLATGTNAMGCMLGNGWYNPLPLRMWTRFNLREALTVGNPCARIQLDLEYEDGSTERITSDTSWKTADGPIRKNSVYLGEWYDARAEHPGWDRAGFDDSAWNAAEPAHAPEGVLQAQPSPPIEVTETIPAVSVNEVQPGVFIYDFGQNLAGRARLALSGPAGTKMQMRYGELLHPDGTLNPMTSVAGQFKNQPVPDGSERPATAWQCDTYVLRGEGLEVFAPRFTFHGFRYVELSGCPDKPALDTVQAHRMHTNVRPAGEFSCSNELFNRIQEVCVRTLRGNIHSVQSDCPHREKFGYGGDLVADSEMGIYNFDMAAFYRKVARDFGDAQRPNGGFTETAPFVGIADEGFGEGSGPIGWGTVHPLLLEQLYTYYGEEALAAEQYEAAKAWLALLERNARDYLLVNGIGDHETLADKDTQVSATAFFYYNARALERIALRLKRNEDAARFGTLAKHIEEAFQTRLIAPDGKVGKGTQACQAFALHMGLVPDSKVPAVLRVMVDDIQGPNRGHLSTGIFGTKYMLHALSDFGAHETAYTVANQPDFPGWGHMLANGATTLWEHWEFSDNTFSHNHPMFGTISEWFYKELAGIQPLPESRGFDVFRIQPRIANDLSWVKARYNSLRGPIVSQWEKSNGRLLVQVRIPVNTKARVVLPVADLDKLLKGDRASISPNAPETGWTAFELGSGAHHFEIAYP